MMRRMSAADHLLVTEAVAAAEADTDGEIVTLVAGRSDSYRDVALLYAALAMLAVPAVLALIPEAWADRATGLLLGWNGDWTRGGLMLALVLAMALAFALVRAALTWTPLLTALTPGFVKTGRVRRRAVAHFRAACEGRTQGRTGILVYLSLAERRAEIVADRAITAKVEDEAWGEAMAAMLAEVKAGRIGAGIAAAVGRVGKILAEHLPRRQGDANELPDRLIEL